MALVPCPHCKHLVSDKAHTCPSCGKDLSQIISPATTQPEQPASSSSSRRLVKPLLWVLLVALLVLAAGYFFIHRQQFIPQHQEVVADTLSAEFCQKVDSSVVAHVPGAVCKDYFKQGNAIYLLESDADRAFNASHEAPRVSSLYLYEADKELSTLLVSPDPSTGLSTFTVDRGSKVRLSINDARFVCGGTRVVFSCPMGNDGDVAVMICEISDHLVKTLAIGKSFSLDADKNVLVQGALHEGVRQDMAYDPTTGWPLR